MSVIFIRYSGSYIGAISDKLFLLVSSIIMVIHTYMCTVYSTQGGLEFLLHQAI